MTANELFREMLQDPILKGKYGLTEEQLSKCTLSQPSGIDVIEVIKLMIMGIENNIPERSINNQVKTHFSI